MKTVYFVRHGQSEANAAPVFQGPNSPLSGKGIHQAEAIANRVSKISFDAFISSPLARAKQTAEAIVLRTGRQPEYSDLFIERVKPSQLNGKEYTDTTADTLWESWNESLYTEGLRVLDGENYDDLVVRADKALDFLRAKEEQTLLVVTHGYFLRMLVARVLLAESLTGSLFRHFQALASTENTSMTVFQYRDSFRDQERWRLQIYNDHAHLG